MNSTKIKNLFFGIIISLCTFVCGMAIFPTNNNLNFAKAEDGTVPSYFTAAVTNDDTGADVATYNSGDTVLLKEGETFEIRLGNGKSLNLSSVTDFTSLGLEESDFATIDGNINSPDPSQFFPLDLSLSQITVTRDNEQIALEDFQDTSRLIYNVHYFSFNYNGTEPTQGTNPHKVFENFSLKLSAGNFTTGKYTFTFNDYYEYSGTDYITSSTNSFSVTFYIFNETDYLTTSGEARITASNVRTENLASSSRTYQRNYFFNYQNQNSNINTTLNLPTLTFDGSKFSVEIQKTFQGQIQTAHVYFNGTNVVVQGDDIVLTKLTGEKTVVITFNDLGEYVLTYHFIYLMDGQTVSSPTELDVLNNPTLNNIKQNKLDVYGYQIFYNDVNVGGPVEFKKINSNNEIEVLDGTALLADVTYKNVGTTNNIISDGVIALDPTVTKPQSTNQGPISFRFNGNISNGTLYTYNQDDNTWNSGAAWSNDTITENGIYLLEVNYSYANNISSGVINSNTSFTQYFYFEITTEIPRAITQEITETGSVNLGSSAYTKNEVKVSVEEQSIFNSPVRLVVQSKDYKASTYTALEAAEDGTYTLTENKNYRVVLYYGANYNLDSAKNRVSYFTIDSTPISGMGFKVATRGQASTYTKGAVINFFTNTSATFEWTEKPSGASSTAYYKYIPFTTSTLTDNPSSSGFSNTVTQTFFDNNNALRNGYALNYSLSTTLIETIYNNTSERDVVTDSSILSRQGLYLFHITDAAGNEAYAALIIDNTSPIILQEIDGVYEAANPYNVISADAKIDWGQYKLISTGLTSTSLNGNQIDPWLKTIIQEKLADGSNDFAYFTDGNLYISPEISSTAYLLINNTYSALNNRYSYNIQFIQNNVANESNYTFFIIDESNQYYNSLTQEHFVNNSSASLNIKVSSDASGADVLIMPEDVEDLYNLNTSPLSEVGTTDSYEVVESNNVYSVNRNYIDTRIKYYTASGIRNASNENVNQFVYIFKPSPNDNINVENVTLYFYPFEQVDENNYSTYKLSETHLEPIVIYDRSDGINLATAFESVQYEGFYYYIINVSYINQAYQTLEGKYVIERTYTDETESYLQSTDTNDRFDYYIRKNIFIVDRQNIVSSPQTLVDESYQSLIGQHIYVSMLQGNERTTFNEIYRTYSNNNIAILETNKLPVQIFVPNFKFVNGLNVQNGIANAVEPYNDLSYYYYSWQDPESRAYYYYGDFSPRNDDGTFVLINNDSGALDVNGRPVQNLARTNFTGTSTTTFASSVSNTSFDLSVRIDYSLTEDFSSYTVFENLTVNNETNYFTSGLITNAGYYRITITQNATSPAYPNVQTSISFIVEILNRAPEFEFTTVSNEALNTYPSNDPTAVTYFNGETVRVTWTDSTSEYIAKIDRFTDANEDGLLDKIYWYTSNDPTTLHYVPMSSVNNLMLNSYYFDLDVSTIASGSSVFVYMAYEGTDYNNGYYSITRELYIDRQAPIQKLQALADKTELSGNQFAEYARRYVDLEETSSLTGLSVSNIGTSTNYKYNISANTGALAYFSFMLTPAEFRNFVTPSITNNYGEGYYYYYRAFADGTKYNSSEYWQETSVINAQNAIASHTLLTSTTNFENFNTNTYYEIIEFDLAGNISIYTIYLLDPNNVNTRTVSMLEATGANPNGDGNISFTGYNLDMLSSQPTQNIYARNNFNVSQFGLYDFNIGTQGYFVFSVGNSTYLASPYLDKNTFYNITSWSGSSTTYPTTVTLSEILNMDVSLSSAYRQLRIQDSALNAVYTFNIYCSGQDLNVTLASNGEGITITAPNYLTLDSIIISEWVSATIEFVQIYTGTGTYNSNEYIDVTASSTSWTFMVRNPLNVAYRYTFVDNFGKTYSIAHTYGTTVITDAVVGEIAEIVDEDYNTWYYGINAMSFYYNEVDYNARIAVDYLTVSASRFTFQTALSERDVVNPTPSTNNIYYSCTSPSNDATIGIISLKTPTDILSTLPFTGGVYKFTIRLINVNDGSEQVYHIIINTLKPNVNLYDRNDTNQNSLFDSYAIFSGQLRIEYSDIFNYLSPSVETVFFFPYELTIQFGNGEETALIAGTVVEEVGTYTIRIYGVINGRHLIETKTFTISDSQRDFYQLVYYNQATGNYTPAIETGSPYVRQDGITSYTTHYILNSSYEFYTNDVQDITVTELTGLEETRNGTTTRFYRISNYGSTDPNINLFNKTVAVTTVPNTSSIVNNFTYFNSTGIETPFTGISLSIISTSDEQATELDLDTLTIRWNSYYLIPENKIEIEVKYGSNAENTYNTSNITQSGGMYSLDLTISGEYTITFKDLAGNVHTFTHPTFGYQSQSYSLTFIKNVVFTVNGESPIDNAIYNGNVVVAIPENTVDYYDTGYQPQIHVQRNGADYEISRKDGVYTFTETGFYYVYFTARINGRDVRVEGSTFTIINANETRWAFEYSEYENYEITSVTKDGVELDLTRSSKYVVYNEGLDNEYVVYKNVLISLYDERTGAGRYEITIRTNGEIENQSFSFGFWINDAEIPIQVSVAEGTSTTDPITVTYNPYNLYSNAGDCMVVVGNNIATINAENSSPTVEEITIDRAGTYFIQILTDSGRLLYSYKVIKTEPLSTLAIILIVVGCVVVVAVVVVMILLRKKMKVR
ncbi:MAG TPA: hypothetical protein IAA62_00310 [Candidatus Caccopulliclostridium gallistercoris]|uniref:Uncharacterized protein n=1 Tax=Candidatus Caccopulliclostridium gallistercoris TaxID=2840719 RepID=A0A9D1NDU3_9FIRM|nr:hypothetical protein [Candidatus Caccopulliclostridium gallistercoris]